jgi:hypothetical protein
VVLGTHTDKMVSYRIIAFAGLAAALPLNINLGAYSPALVVGDGEISFGGRQDVSNLMNALEGAAVNAAAGAATAGGAAAAPAAAAPATAQPAAAANAASVDPTLSQQAQQVAGLQGMGKEIAPRVGETVAKRDLAGFDCALKFAETALTKGPKVQLGTGEGGSGVGIVVDNNPTAAARPGKRNVDEAAAPRRRAKVTTMYVRRGVPASLQSPSEIDVRDIAAAQPAIPAASFSRRDAIDAVNLNVDGNEGVTMTFVEMDADEED